MKNISQYLLASMALLMLTACPNDPEEVSETQTQNQTQTQAQTQTQTYNQSIMLSPNAIEQEVILNGLNSPVATVTNSAEWLTVETNAYTSGSVKVKVSVTANVSKEERKCTVTITATSGDKVILSVTQQGIPEGTGIDDLHGSQTDKPAYSRQKW